MDIVPEPTNLPLLITNLVALVVLIGAYFGGVMLRYRLLPADTAQPWHLQLAAAVPVGLLTMGGYAKSAVPPILQARSDVAFDIAIALGYAIILGMISREALDKLIQHARQGGGGG